MKESETTLEPARDIEQLKAQHLAALKENTGSRKVATPDRIEIGDLKQARRQIEILNCDPRRRNRALEAVNQELESFSYAVSHDLRSPLRSIHGFSEALRQDVAAKLSPEETNWLQKISDAAAGMDRLTEELLRLSRITRSQLKREPVNLGLLAREVVHELRQTDPRRDAVFAIPDSLEAHADPVLMRVALGNLLGNAWNFCVRDNGAGFDMAYASKLFAPFSTPALRARVPRLRGGTRLRGARSLQTTWGRNARHGYGPIGVR